MWGHWASGQGPHHSSEPGRHSGAAEAVLFWQEYTVKDIRELVGVSKSTPRAYVEEMSKKQV